MQLTTTDINEASYLKYSGFQVAEMWVDRSKIRTTVCFCFEGDQHLTEFQKAYHMGEAEVNLVDFCQCLARLRSTMFKLIEDQKQNSKPQQERNRHHDSRRHQEVH